MESDLGKTEHSNFNSHQTNVQNLGSVTAKGRNQFAPGFNVKSKGPLGNVRLKIYLKQKFLTCQISEVLEMDPLIFCFL